MELKRIYNKKQWLLLVLFLAVNLIFFARERETTVTVPIPVNSEFYQESEDGRAVFQEITLDEAYQEYHKLLGAMLSDEDELLEAYETSHGLAGIWAVAHYRQEHNAMQWYSAQIQEILNASEQMGAISIFNREDGFSAVNRKKTAEDFRELLSLDWKVTDYYGISSVMEYRIVFFLLALFMLTVVWQFGAEQKLGLWGLIHQTVAGRGKLVGRRMGILALSAAFSTVCFYGLLLVWALPRYGGMASLGVPVQTIEAFRRVPCLWTVGQMLAVQLLVTAVGLFLLALLMWLCLVLVSNRTVAILLFGTVLCAEYLCYVLIGSTSWLSVLHYMNLFQTLFPYQWLSQYRNWGFGTWIIGQESLIVTFIMVTVLLLCGLTMYLNIRKFPIYETSRLERLFQRISARWSCVIEMLPLFGKLLYQLLIQQRAILFLVFAVYIAQDCYTVSGVIYGEDGNLLESFYQEHSGLPDEASNQWLLDEKAYIDELNQTIADTNEAYARGEISLAEQQNRVAACTGILQFETKKYYYVAAQQEYLDTLKEESKIEGWIVDERGFETMLGKRNYQRQQTLGLVAVLLTVLAVSVLFSKEEHERTQALLRSAGGRARLTFQKYVVAFAYLAVLWLILYGINAWNMIQTYHLSNWQAPVQSIRLLSDFPLHISIGTYMAFLYGGRLVLLLLVSWMALFISRRCSYYQSILLSVLLILPHVLYLLGLPLMKWFSLVFPIVHIEAWNEYGSSLQVWIPLWVITVLGIAALLYEPLAQKRYVARVCGEKKYKGEEEQR